MPREGRGRLSQRHRQSDQRKRNMEGFHAMYDPTERGLFSEMQTTCLGGFEYMDARCYQVAGSEMYVDCG